MTIRVEILAGHAAPWSGTFDKACVTIGRAADADVRLHPTRDTVCATGIHARLERRDGRWMLLPVHASGVLVAEPGSRPTRHDPGANIPLAGEVEFTLGQGGPRLAAIPDYAPIPSTRKQHHGVDTVDPPVARVPAEVIRQAQQSHARVRRLSWAAGVVAVIFVGALGAVIWWMVASAGVTAAQIEHLAG